VTEPNSFEDPEFLKDLESINERLSKTAVSQPRSKAPAIADVTELTGALAAPNAGRESRLNEELEQACLATGATGAAIALLRGQEMVCHAAAGPHAPSVGVSLDPRTGLSGSCIQTRRLQHCVDTETDPRVNAEACRRLGVRSIVALPLMEGGELFGIVEILSSRPNAFSARDLDSLKALTDRIVETRRLDMTTTATVVPQGVASLQPKEAQVVPQEKTHSAEPKSESPRAERVSTRNDMWTPVLGTLVIGVAILLGILMGWRHGWNKATLGFRASSSPHRVDAASRNARTDQAVSPEQEPRPSSAGTEDCGPSAAPSPDESLSSGLTICQQGQVIFRLPPSAPRTQRNLQTPQRSKGLKGDTAKR
jgi:hypothetical protein